MPKNTTGKNTKGTKKTTTKASTASTKKVQAKAKETKVQAKAKATEKNSTPKKEVIKEEVKKVVKTEKKGKKTNSLLSNTPFVVACCVIIVLLAVLIFTICVKRVPKNSNGDEILATLNGKTITANDLYQQLKEENGTNALVNIVDEYITDKEVKITDEDKKYVQEVVDYYKEYADYYSVDLNTFLANYMGLTGINTEKEFYDYVLKDYKKSLAVIKFIGDSAKEEDLKKYYKENYTDSLTVKHILIEVDAEAKDQEAAEKEAYDKAVSLIKKLKKYDKDELDAKFEKLAKNNSDDTATYSNGGLIENFSKKDVVEEFWNASNKLKDGEFTAEPVKTSYGYHIILKVSSTPAKKYRDIKDEVKKDYAESLINEDAKLQISKWDELRAQYKLSIKDDFIKKNYKKTLKEALEAKEQETETGNEENKTEE